MVDDQVIDLAVADGFADIGFEAAAEGLFDGVDQGDLFAYDQIGILGNPLGKRPETFETGCGPVVYTDIVDAGEYFRDGHMKNGLCFGSKFTKKTVIENRFLLFFGAVSLKGFPGSCLPRAKNPLCIRSLESSTGKSPGDSVPRRALFVALEL